MSFTNTIILQIIIFYCLVIAFHKSPTLKSNGMWVYPQILRGLALWQQGEVTTAETILSRYQVTSG